MDKRYLHHLLKRLRVIKVWYFLVLVVVFAGLSVWGLRSNYVTMVELREAVYLADKQGADVEQALQDLRAHVNAHMNTNLSKGAGAVYPPVQLKNTYERLKKAEQDRVDKVNSEVYTQAQGYCEGLYPSSFSGGPRVPCIEQYVKEHGAKVQAIPADLYRFSFASPVWSPDLAGWSIVLAVLLLGLAVVRFLTGRLLEVVTEK